MPVAIVGVTGGYTAGMNRPRHVASGLAWYVALSLPGAGTIRFFKLFRRAVVTRS